MLNTHSSFRWPPAALLYLHGAWTAQGHKQCIHWLEGWAAADQGCCLEPKACMHLKLCRNPHVRARKENHVGSKITPDIE
eukprot:1136861-Pelagomonas_calceolata.AAC.7